MSKIILGPIVGGVAHDRAHLWGRADGEGVLHAWIGANPDLSDAQLVGTSLPLESASGFAGVVPLSGVRPATRYHYSLSLSAAPPRPLKAPYPAFSTFPPPHSRNSFNFAFGSCFRPADAHGGKIFTALDERRQTDDLRFLLMIGDQIYADAFAYNGIGKIACTLEEYRQVYTYTWSRPALRRLLSNLPVFMTLDDHEVDDDWRWLDSQRRWAVIPWWDQVMRWFQGRPPQERHLPLQRVQDALQACWEHQFMHAPHLLQPPVINQAGQYDLAASLPGSLAYTFNFGAAAFFVLDTRTMRVRNRRERSMLGADQWQALESWLLQVKDAYPVKFLVSSCSLLYNLWLDIPRDRWSGFPAERDHLLHFLAANDIRGVYVLAGDLHAAHAVHAELYGSQGSTIHLWEFCSTPFEQKPARLTRILYNPLPFGPLKRLERAFTVHEANFGAVRVDFSQAEPRVWFQVYGADGQMLASAGG